MKKRILISILFMTLGLLIYFLYHNRILIKDSIVLSSIRNFVPDMCWIFSFFFININFARVFSKKPVLLTSINILIIAICCEFLQRQNIVKGTFDIIDIFVYFISIMLAWYIEKVLRRKEYEKSI